MATSLYFNNFGASQEQNLIEDLIIESIRIYGIDVYYLPRTIVNKDAVFRDPEYATFNSSYTVEMYIKNTMGFQGDGEFLSKFGIQVRDQITFTMAQRTFNLEIGQALSYARPKEGDLIYFPLTQTLYQIKFVDVKAVFYQLGALQTYDVVCELYESNSEVFNTGITEIDSVYNALTLDSGAYGILVENGNSLITEAGETILLETYQVETVDAQAENQVFEQLGDDFIDFTEIDPFSEGTRA